MKDYTNPDGTPVEFRILEPTLSVLNLPVPIEAQYVKFKIQVIMKYLYTSMNLITIPISK